MTKRYTLIGSALMALALQATAQTYLNENFTGGIPADFTLIDNDRNTPSKDMQNLGFGVGTPWIAITPKGESNQVACSTSWYSPKGQSDDWMILPPMTITSAHAELSWRSKAVDKKYRDGLIVKIAPADGDEWSDLVVVEQEENAWTNHTVSLAEYVGKTIRIAFVNQSDNKSHLYLDDIFVAEHTTVALRPDFSTTTPSVGRVPVSMTVFAPTSEPVEGFTAGYTIGGVTYSQHFSQTLQPGEEVKIVLSDSLSLTDRQSVSLTAFVETADGCRHEQPRTLTCYQRKMVVEEATGTWCSWCVRGIVMLDSIKRYASDWFIGISLHKDDVMENDYCTQLDKLFSINGLPTAILARTTSVDTRQILSIGRQAFNYEPVYVSVLFNAQFDEQGRVATTTNLRFADDYADAGFRLAYAIIENNVHHPDDERYYQNNAAYSREAYVGRESEWPGPMGGWEDKPKMIYPDEMYFQEVARGFSGDFTGIEGSVPAQITAGEDVVYDHLITLPDNVDNADEVEIVVMLIDAADNHIVNAEIVKPTPYTSGIETVQGAQLRAQSDDMGCYDLTGRRMLSASKPGLYIIGGRKVVCK